MCLIQICSQVLLPSFLPSSLSLHSLLLIFFPLFIFILRQVFHQLGWCITQTQYFLMIYWPFIRQLTVSLTITFPQYPIPLVLSPILHPSFLITISNLVHSPLQLSRFQLFKMLMLITLLIAIFWVLPMGCISWDHYLIIFHLEYISLH